MLQIPPIKEEKISISIEGTTEGGTLTFTGDIDMADPSPILDPLFEKVHSQAVEGGAKLIQLDFNQLHFLNSSGIKAIAKWIMRLATVSDEQKYTIRILHNEQITWQVTSLPTLTFLVPGSVVIR